MYKRYTNRHVGKITSIVESWKSIKGYDGMYEISSFGNVRSLDRVVENISIKRPGTTKKISGRLLVCKTDRYGYESIGLRKNKTKKFFSVHRLVATAFVPNENQKPTVNHIDGVKKNNNVSNLEWATASEQAVHALSNNLMVPCGKQKYSQDLKRKIYRFYMDNQDVSVSEISRIFSVGRKTVSGILKNGVQQKTTTRVVNGVKIKDDVLSEESISEIFSLRKDGKTLKFISEKFDRGISQIHRILTGKSRKSPDRSCVV